MDNERKGNGQAQPNEEPRERVFFDLVGMTKDFREWNERLDAPREPGEENLPGDQRELMNSIQVWQARAMMTIAQQLLVTNIHLKKLVEQNEVRKNPVSVGPARKTKSGPRVD